MTILNPSGSPSAYQSRTDHAIKNPLDHLTSTQTDKVGRDGTHNIQLEIAESKLALNGKMKPNAARIFQVFNNEYD